MRALALFLMLWAGAAGAACRQALVLALDVSGSVDEAEYVLQLNGVATALEHSDVVAALLELPEAPVHLAIFEWSSSAYQRDVLSWTALTDAGTIRGVAAHLRRWRRSAAPEATGIGAAMQYARAMFRNGPVCWRRTLDISGDGKNNDWPIPRDLKHDGLMDGTTINGLVIGVEMLDHDDERALSVAELSQYYRFEIIHGPGAFVEVALGYEDYAAAMARKLLRELKSFALSRDADGGAMPGRALN